MSKFTVAQSPLAERELQRLNILVETLSNGSWRDEEAKAIISFAADQLRNIDNIDLKQGYIDAIVNAPEEYLNIIYWFKELQQRGEDLGELTALSNAESKELSRFRKIEDCQKLHPMVHVMLTNPQKSQDEREFIGDVLEAMSQTALQNPSRIEKILNFAANPDVCGVAIAAMQTPDPLIDRGMQIKALPVILEKLSEVTSSDDHKLYVELALQNPLRYIRNPDGMHEVVQLKIQNRQTSASSKLREQAAEIGAAAITSSQAEQETKTAKAQKYYAAYKKADDDKDKVGKVNALIGAATERVEEQFFTAATLDGINPNSADAKKIWDRLTLVSSFVEQGSLTPLSKGDDAKAQIILDRHKSSAQKLTKFARDAAKPL